MKMDIVTRDFNNAQTKFCGFLKDDRFNLIFVTAQTNLVITDSEMTTLALAIRNKEG